MRPAVATAPQSTCCWERLPAVRRLLLPAAVSLGGGARALLVVLAGVVAGGGPPATRGTAVSILPEDGSDGGDPTRDGLAW